VELDHVLIAVPNLIVAAERLAANVGLASLEGGVHPGRGTGNRIVPLGDSYLELVTVVDPGQASENAFGRWVAANLAGHGRPLGWAVRTDDLDAVARRLDLTSEPGSRETPDGLRLSWRTAGAERATSEPLLPFFIEWGAGTPHPGRADVQHPAGDWAIARVELTGNAASLAEWLGNQELPVDVRPGAAAVAGVALSSAAGEILLDASTL
jgi:Glyoxalase-like domain